MDSWELTDFNIEGQIVLSDKFGLLKIQRSDDGLLILVGDSKYGVIDQEKPTPASFVRTDSLLGFVMDIGIQKEKRLTYATGFYFGHQLVGRQSNRKVAQEDFDKELFEKIGTGIDFYYQSGDKHKEQEAIRVQLLLDEYNDARLLYPNFHSNSYLSLMRLIDAVSNARRAYDFALAAANISLDLNREVYEKLQGISGYKDRLEKALTLFDTTLALAKKDKAACVGGMSSIDEAGRVMFACFYSAYQYRNKFVHKGIPFPDTVKEMVGGDTSSGLAYLNPALAISWSKFHRPTTGIGSDDLIDIHEIVGDEAQTFKETYFLLLPSWYFMKQFAREAVLRRAENLDSGV